MQRDDQADQDYRRLPITQVASMLYGIGAILLPHVRTAQQQDQNWADIVRQIQTSPDDDIKMALYQLNRLDQAHRLEDDSDEPRRLAGLSRDDFAILIGLLPDPLEGLRDPKPVEGRLFKQANGRYAIEGDPDPDFEYQSGEPVELYLYDQKAEQWQWIKTYLDHQDGDYYADARPDMKLAGVTARRYSTFR